MDSLKWPLLFVCLCFKVIQTEASPWTLRVPSSVKGLRGSCVVIPCSFNYPDPVNTVTKFTGMWSEETNHLIYHPIQSDIMQQYRNRTELLGDVSEKNCTLKIDPLQQSDHGPFHFRIEMENYEKFSYKDSKVSITMISELNPITFSVKEEVEEGNAVSASCSVSHSCPFSPPVFTWSHSGGTHSQSQQLDEAGQWKETSILTFQATSADHKKPLQCNVKYKGGRQQNTSKVLEVKYAPVNVKVKYKSDVKEGEAVQLKCSSDAHPPASSYEWRNENGVRLHQGSVYMLPNVTRHSTEALYCTAHNTQGQGKSSPVQLNVLYAPEIRVVSSCSSKAHMVNCVCIAESKPPSMVHFVLSDKVLATSKTEKQGSVTIGTLQADLGSAEFVLCQANNTQGNASLTLYLPVNSKMQSLYIIIAIGVGVILMIPLIAVGVVKKCRGRSEDAATPHMSTMKADRDVELPQYAATKRKNKTYDDVQCPDVYANDSVYGNMETDWDDAIYANM